MSHSEDCTSAEVCSIVRAVRLAGSEWSLIICYYLLDAPKGFNELLRIGKEDELNSRTLSRTLKALVGRNVVNRTITSTQPFSVLYSLTEKGRALETILNAYRDWGRRWLAPEAGPVQPPMLEARASIPRRN